ncbi:MAG: CHAT domain-containing protein [Gemmatimonadaceae bacterium]|nr:CHAT domain-containing protein [Acetobacteraceae bacterium]
MKVYCVSNDQAVTTAVNDAFDFCVPPGNAVLHLLLEQYTDGAEARLQNANRKARLPDALLLDTESRGSHNSTSGQARTAWDLLKRVTSDYPDLPIVLVTRGTEDSRFDIEAILRKQVWTWDVLADGGEGRRLIAALETAISPPPTRNLCATIKFDRDSAGLSIEENGVSLMASRPLLLSEVDRQEVDSLANRSLDKFVNGADMADCWKELSAVGKQMFSALFGKDYFALLASDAPVTIEFRFEISPGVLANRFGLPLELLSRGDVRNGFLCRLLPMARRVGPLRPVSAGVDTPHILFVDAGAAAGQSEILIEQEMRPTGFPALQAIADQQYIAMDAMARAGRCTVERWSLPAFEREYGNTAAYSEALRRRLQEPLPGHKPIDILHFSGHGVTPPGGDTRLVLPGLKPRSIEMLMIGRLAEWLPDSIRLVFLGACQSVSASTASLLHNKKHRCSVVGFRWEIQADRIPAFVEQFYRAHLHRRHGIAASYREACHATHDDEHTVWASAVALAAD